MRNGYAGRVQFARRKLIRMKVLQVYKDYYPPVKGGIEGLVNSISNGLKQRGVEVEVLVSNTRATFKKEIIDGITVTKAPQLGRIASAPLNFTFPYHLRRLAKDAHIVHFHFPNPTGELSCLLGGLNNRVVVSYHSDIIRQKRLGRLYRPFLKKFLEISRVIIVASPSYLRSSVILNQFRDKCRVIPYGIDLEKFSPFSERCGDKNLIHNHCGVSTILFVGRFRYYKGLHVLIEAMSKVDGKLLLIGAGPLERELRKLTAEKRMEEKIIFMGELSDRDVVGYLRSSDIFVLPSILRSEAFGIVLLEAMACGKPVVSTELNTGTSFINQHQKTGLVVPPGNVEALADAINFLLADSDIRKKYGDAGRRRVEKCFSSKRMIEKLVRTYEEIL